jgi:hypothetical protein
MTGAWNRYWFETETSRERLVVLRVLFFGLLAVDLWKYVITRAYRVGAGDFNVSHVPALDPFLPMPTSAVYVFSYLVAGFLAATIATGLRARWATPLLTALYAGTYFWSQQDGYQHHYLIALVLLIACFVPWHATPPGPPVRSWAVQLVRAQIAIVYLFGAVAKMDGHWLDGWALSRQIGDDGLGAWLVDSGAAMGLAETTAFAIASWAIMLWELFVAVAFVVPALHTAAFVTGPFFHGMIELLGYEIRLFSLYMLLFYTVLTMPERWFAPIARRVSSIASRTAAALRRWSPGGPRSVPAALATMVCAGAALSQPYPGALATALAFAAIVVLRELTTARTTSRDAWRRALLHIGAAAVMVLLTRPGGAAYEYWRLEGGDLRRRGDLEGAAEAYERAVAVANVTPSRERALASLYVRLERLEEAAAMYERAIAADPDDERSIRALEVVHEAIERRRLSGADASAPTDAPSPDASDAPSTEDRGR